MPTLEQEAGPSALRLQMRQPSVHSRQAAAGGASGFASAGASAGWVLGSSGRSAASAGAIEISAAAISQRLTRSPIAPLLLTPAEIQTPPPDCQRRSACA